MTFSYGDISPLREAASSLRTQTPEYDQSLYGFIYRLTRSQDDIDGTVTLHTSVGGRERSVTAALSKPDYPKAVEAHRTQAIVCLEGDLERSNQRLHLRNARLVEVIQAPPLFSMGDADDRQEIPVSLLEETMPTRGNRNGKHQQYA